MNMYMQWKKKHLCLIISLTTSNQSHIYSSEIAHIPTHIPSKHDNAEHVPWPVIEI